MGYQSSKHAVTVAPSAEGDYIDDLKFVLYENSEGAADTERLPIEEPIPAKETIIRTRKFTLGETNPALLALLKNKTLEEQKQIMENML